MSLNDDMLMVKVCQDRELRCLHDGFGCGEGCVQEPGAGDRSHAIPLGHACFMDRGVSSLKRVLCSELQACSPIPATLGTDGCGLFLSGVTVMGVYCDSEQGRR